MLTEAQLQFYRVNGYIALDDVFTSAELEECSIEYDALFRLKENSNLEATWKGDWQKNSSIEAEVL